MRTILFILVSAFMATFATADGQDEPFQGAESDSAELAAWQNVWRVCEFPWKGTLAESNEIHLGRPARILSEGDEVTVEYDSLKGVVMINGEAIMDGPSFDPDDNLRPRKNPGKYRDVPFVRSLADSIPDLASRAELYLIEKRRLQREAQGEYSRMLKEGASEDEAAHSAASVIKGSLLVSEARAEATGTRWKIVIDWDGYRRTNQMLMVSKDFPRNSDRRRTTKDDACYYLHRIQEMCVLPDWGTGLRENCTFVLNSHSSALIDR